MLSIQKNQTNSFLALLSLPSTAMGFALSVQISALSWLLSTEYKLDIHEVGIVWAAGPIAGILGQVIVGFISDNVWFWGGRRKPFIWIGGILAALSLLALPNIGLIKEALGLDAILGVAITVALVLDLSINISFNPTRSIISDVTTEERRVDGYTWMQTISGTFGVLAYAIGAILGNYTLIYFGSFLVLMFSIIPLFFIEEDPDLNIIADEEESESFQTDYPNFIKLFAAHSFTWLGVQTMFVYVFAFIRFEFPAFMNLTDVEMESGYNDTVGQIISITFLLLNVVGALLPVLLLSPMSEKIGKVKTHTVCIALMAISYFLIAMMGHSSMMLYGLIIMTGIGWAAVVSLPFAIMSLQVDPKKIGSFMGIFNLSVVIPQLIASLVIGKIVNQSDDKSIIFWICGISLAISAILWVLVKEPKSRKIENNGSGGGH